LTSATKAKSELNAHFECLRECVNEALSERLNTLQQSVDAAVTESMAPLEHCQQELQQRVIIAIQIMDTGLITIAAMTTQLLQSAPLKTSF